MSAADLLRRLRRLASKRGLVMVEQQGKGSHLKVTLGDRRTIIARHAGDMRSGTFRAILKDLGLAETDLEV